MSDELVQCDVTAGVAVLTLNRPAALNPLSDAMLAALKARLERLADAAEARVIILRGAGKAFCAGHDLKEMQAGRAAPDRGAAYFADLFARCSELMQLIPTLPQPVIAQVHGIATAAGCQLVASCDMAVAAEGTRFGVNGVNIGLFCSTPMVALSRNVANKHAMEMLLTGDMIEAPRAAEMGLVNHAVPAADLTATVMDMARKIASKSSMTLATGKRAFYAQREMPLSDAYDYASQVMVENMLAHDATEGIGAFIEKRAPQWQDR